MKNSFVTEKIARDWIGKYVEMWGENPQGLMLPMSWDITEEAKAYLESEKIPLTIDRRVPLDPGYARLGVSFVRIH